MEGGAALNRVTWTQSGLHVAAGDDLGKIWVYDVGESLACAGQDEWGKFAHTLQDIRANKTGDEESAGLHEKGGMSVAAAAAASAAAQATGPNSLTSFTSLSSSPLR